jgi:hypothetical protein
LEVFVLTPEQEAAILSTGRYPPASIAAKPRKRLVTEGTLVHLIALVRREVRDEIVAPLVKRIEALEADNANRRHVGAWTPGVRYLRRNGVSFQGSSWECLRDTMARPGDPSGDWAMTTKRGRDGRDYDPRKRRDGDEAS